MAEFSRHIPVPINNLEHLAELLSFWNEDICKTEKLGKSYIHSVVLITEGPDNGKNVVWFRDSKTEPLSPKRLATFPTTLSNEDRRKKILELEDAEKLELRSSAIVLFADGEKWVAIFDGATVAQEPVSTPITLKPGGATGSLSFLKTKARVSNRGVPASAFLQELVEWARTAPPEIFEDKQTKEKDVYASVKGELGPYRDLLHRKACMLEVMRVLAGFESSWDWTEGRDIKNTPAGSARNEIEAGAWQVSANSIAFGKDLKELVLDKVKSTDAVAFQEKMKGNHSLAMEYVARLLRHTVRHNGPVKRSEINEWLSPEAVKEFQQLLTA